MYLWAVWAATPNSLSLSSEEKWHPVLLASFADVNKLAEKLGFKTKQNKNSGRYEYVRHIAQNRAKPSHCLYLLSFEVAPLARRDLLS